MTAGADKTGTINKTKQNNMETKTITYIEESTFETATRLTQERFNNGNITGAMAMMQIAEAFEPDTRSWID